MRILVLGGTAFLSAAIVRQAGALNALGDQVPFGEYISASRLAADHHGEVVPAAEGTN